MTEVRQTSTVNIFYSWQSDLPNPTNRAFIQNALEKAAAEIRRDKSIAVEPVVDRDTQGVPGAPDIVATILEKIDNSDIFVCDASIVTKVKNKDQYCPNPNVLLELGYALKRLGWRRIVLVVNEAFGSTKRLPFDLNRNRALVYRLKKDQDKTIARKELTSKLCSALAEIVKAIEAERAAEQSTISNSVDDSPLVELRKGVANRYMEIAAYQENTDINVKKRELKNAVISARIKPFGTAIVGPARERPELMKIVKGGIRFEFKNRYHTKWLLRQDGSFFLVKTLYEDKEGMKDVVLFDVLIRRLAESLVFSRNLYTELKGRQRNRIIFELALTGCAGKSLSALDEIRRARMSPPYHSEENKLSTGKLVFTLQNFEANFPNLVLKGVNTILEYFDDFEVSRDTCNAIVEKDVYKNGKVVR